MIAPLEVDGFFVDIKVAEGNEHRKTTHKQKSYEGCDEGSTRVRAGGTCVVVRSTVLAYGS